MSTYDPSKPVTISNWPRGLRMPPLRRASPQPSKKPDPEADEQAPWWDHEM